MIDINNLIKYLNCYIVIYSFLGLVIIFIILLDNFDINGYWDILF